MTAENPRRNYESQDRMYPILKDVNLGGLTSDGVVDIVDFGEAGPRTLYETVRLLKCDGKYLDDRQARAILGRMTKAGYNVNFVQKGDRFDLEAGSILIKERNGGKYVISLADEEAAEKSFEVNGSLEKYLPVNKREDLKVLAKQAWQNKREALTKHIPYDVLRSQGYNFTNEELGNLWAEIGENKKFIESGLSGDMKAVDVSKKYEGTESQNLLVLEYLKWKPSQRELDTPGPVDTAPIVVEKAADPLGGISERVPLTAARFKELYKVGADASKPKSDEVFIGEGGHVVKIVDVWRDYVTYHRWNSEAGKFGNFEYKITKDKIGDLSKLNDENIAAIVRFAEEGYLREEEKTKNAAEGHKFEYDNARLGGVFATSGMDIFGVSKELGKFVEVGKTVANQKVAVLREITHDGTEYYGVVTDRGVKGYVEKIAIVESAIKPLEFYLKKPEADAE